MSDTYSSDAITFSDTTWKHVAVTLDSVEKKITFYENGVAKGTRDMTNAFIPNISGINIGAKSNATDGITNYFDGDLDNVMIHNRVLDLNEIKMLSETKFPAIQNSNCWVHVGASYDKSTGDVAIYKNGAKVGTATGQTITLPDNTNDLKVGTNLKGKMDNFSLFERKISDEEYKVLGNIKRYEGQFYNQENIINCDFNNVLSISNNFRGQYFMFEYLENHAGTVNTGSLNDVDFYESDLTDSVYEKNVRDLTTAKLFHLSSISNITKIQVKNVDTNFAVKIAALYYSETLPEGKTVDTITVAEFKAHAIFAQNFHLLKGAPTDNQISENIAVNVAGNGIHGVFASPPIKSSSNHYGGTYNKSVAIGGNPDNHLQFNGTSFDNVDFTESYMSSWINPPVALTQDFYIFQKTDEFSFKCAKDVSGSMYLCAEYYNGTGMTLVTSTLTVTVNKWTNVGVHFNRQNNKLTFFKKEVDVSSSEIDVHDNLSPTMSINTTATTATNIRTFIENNTSNTVVYVDNLRIDLGYFNGTDKFIEFADVNNEVSISQIENDTWTHVAATYESSKGRVKMYHNGAQVAEFNNYNVVPTNDSNQPVFIGKYGDSVITDNVMLSDVKVYDKVLTDKQISDLYEA